MQFKVDFINLLKVTIVAVLVIIASTIGKNRAKDSQYQLMVDYFNDSTVTLNEMENGSWEVIDNNNNVVSVLYIGNGQGYNGDIVVLTQIDSTKRIQSVISLIQHETPSYFNKLEKSRFFLKFSGVDIVTFVHKANFDVISGATISSKAVNEAVIYGYVQSENIQINQSNLPKFGFVEFLILVLFIGGYIYPKIRSKKLRTYTKWFLLLMSFLILGFIYNQHITLSRISAMINGFFPSIFNELYFYLLIIGGLLFVLIANKNIYCNSVCPFGTAQDLLALTGNAKSIRPKFHNYLKWIQSLVALGVLLVSLAYNNPTIAQYEVFGAFFQLTANYLLFGLLIFVIILSLFIKKPWCNYMCPIDSVFGFVKLTKKSVIQKK